MLQLPLGATCIKLDWLLRFTAGKNRRRGRVFCCVERSLAWYTIYSRALPVEHEQTDLWEEYIRGKTDHYKSKTVGIILISFLSLLHSRQQLGGILSRSEQNL